MAKKKPEKKKTPSPAPKGKKKADMSKQEIEQRLMEENRKQVIACQQELAKVIQPVLDKYQCQLDISVTLRQGQIIPNLGVIPRPPAPTG